MSHQPAYFKSISRQFSGNNVFFPQISSENFEELN